jgi:hypothetical protein
MRNCRSMTRLVIEKKIDVKREVAAESDSEVRESRGHLPTLSKGLARSGLALLTGSISLRHGGRG